MCIDVPGDRVAAGGIALDRHAGIPGEGQKATYKYPRKIVKVWRAP
jgi:hypothetical protein